jgi:hypothetical protein
MLRIAKVNETRLFRNDPNDIHRKTKYSQREDGYEKDIFIGGGTGVVCGQPQRLLLAQAAVGAAARCSRRRSSMAGPPASQLNEVPIKKRPAWKCRPLFFVVS